MGKWVSWEGKEGKGKGKWTKDDWRKWDWGQTEKNGGEEGRDGMVWDTDFRHRQSAKEHLELETMTDFWAEIGRCSPMFTRGGHSTRGWIGGVQGSWELCPSASCLDSGTTRVDKSFNIKIRKKTRLPVRTDITVVVDFKTLFDKTSVSASRLWKTWANNADNINNKCSSNNEISSSL